MLLCPTRKYLEALLIANCSSQTKSAREMRQLLKYLQFGSGSIFPNTVADAVWWWEEILYLLEMLEMKILAANLCFLAQWAKRKQWLARCSFSTLANYSRTQMILQDMHHHTADLTVLWSRASLQVLGMLLNSGKTRFFVLLISDTAVCVWQEEVNLLHTCALPLCLRSLLLYMWLSCNHCVGVWRCLAFERPCSRKQ